MEIRQLEYLVTAVEKKSFQKAGQALFTSQPAVSKAISSLEKELNTVLFERTSKGLIVTPRGEKLYYYAKNILQQVEAMQDINVEESEWALSIASYPSFMFSNALSDFYTKNERLTSLDYREGNVQEIIQLIEKGIVELGIIYISPNQEDLLTHILAHKHLEFVPILKSELCVYVGKRSPYYGKNAVVSVEEASKLKYIRGVRDFFSVEHHFDYVSLNAIDTADFDDRVLTNSDHLVSLMLEKTELAYLGIDTIIKRKESKVVIDSDEKALNLGYIKHKATHLSHVAKEFIEHLIPHITA